MTPITVPGDLKEGPKKGLIFLLRSGDFTAHRYFDLGEVVQISMSGYRRGLTQTCEVGCPEINFFLNFAYSS